LAETSLRAGELAGLKLEDVELDRITINRSIWGGESKTQRRGARLVFVLISALHRNINKLPNPKYWEFRSSMFAYERFSRHAVAAASMRRG
jgi:integrase